MVNDAFDGPFDQGFGLLRGRPFVIGNPGVVLPDIGHLKEERVQATPFAGRPEGFLVHVGGARGNDNPGQTFLFDIVLLSHLDLYLLKGFSQYHRNYEEMFFVCIWYYLI